jgi:hypothetical protein
LGIGGLESNAFHGVAVDEDLARSEVAFDAEGSAFDMGRDEFFEDGCGCGWFDGFGAAERIAGVRDTVN